ncbi:enhancer of polycomb homolog 1 [Schistocerca gregaria]|uniref:enhancer of polycomb homolog 1 n=1 Tax=Schistocerca gregaria TaxID=7010 RepID=UPI00211DBCF0|nr:enhancer of polycomb homolog 1 [Schistocerca gregaria]
MVKLSFRARALDATKPMPIYLAEELPDLPDYTAINRAVPQMPSGMEKEEEREHHLQRAICSGLIIPTPEVHDIGDEEIYNELYPANFEMPRQLIRMQPIAMEQDVIEYDMDSDDEIWLKRTSKLDLTPVKFEEMMDKLEKACGRTVLSAAEAKRLLKEDEDLAIAVYDYWLNKRLKLQQPLIPNVKTEHRLGSLPNNPYVAFRRRTEKIQTRKNRKNGETSYKKMLKLKRDLSRAVSLLELVKRREKTKKEGIRLTFEIFKKRYEASDFSGQLLEEVSAMKQAQPKFTSPFSSQFGLSAHDSRKGKMIGSDASLKVKRHYKKRKHKMGSSSGAGLSIGGDYLHYGSSSKLQDIGTSGDEIDSTTARTMALTESTVSDEEQDLCEGPFAFRRKENCYYHASLCGTFNSRNSTSKDSTVVSNPAGISKIRCRVGRGGRIIFDRGDVLSLHDDDSVGLLPNNYSSYKVKPLSVLNFKTDSEVSSDEEEWLPRPVNDSDSDTVFVTLLQKNSDGDFDASAFSDVAYSEQEAFTEDECENKSISGQTDPLQVIINGGKVSYEDRLVDRIGCSYFSVDSRPSVASALTAPVAVLPSAESYSSSALPMQDVAVKTETQH